MKPSNADALFLSNQYDRITTALKSDDALEFARLLSLNPLTGEKVVLSNKALGDILKHLNPGTLAPKCISYLQSENYDFTKIENKWSMLLFIYQSSQGGNMSQSTVINNLASLVRLLDFKFDERVLSSNSKIFSNAPLMELCLKLGCPLDFRVNIDCPGIENPTLIEYVKALIISGPLEHRDSIPTYKLLKSYEDIYKEKAALEQVTKPAPLLPVSSEAKQKI